MFPDYEPLVIERNGHSVILDHPLIAAPMAGAIEPPYRKLLHDNGITLSYTEMISARGTFDNSSKTMELAGWVPSSGYSAAQIFGPDPFYLEFASRRMVETGHHMVDINAGCPKRKVLKHRAGGHMLKEPSLLIKCATSVLDSVDVPVGIKTRSGFSTFDERSYIDLLKDLEGAGMSYVAIHPRTVKQGFSGSADRDVISTVSSRVDMPVIASGDVTGQDDVTDYLNRGASAVMIGRALLGDPYLPGRILKGDDGDYPCSDEDIDLLLERARDHLISTIEHYGEKRGCVKFRTHLGWYMRGMRNRKSLVGRIHGLSTEDEFLDMIDEIARVWKERA